MATVGPTGSDSAPPVEITEDTDRTARLVRRLQGPPPPPTLRVTDLFNPRGGYWRLRAGSPPLPRPEAAERGIVAHRILPALLGPEARIEVRVRVRGIAGRIDGWIGFPVELKSGAGRASPESWRESRPWALVQLVAYCAMTGASRGWIAHRTTSLDDGGPAFDVAELAVPDPNRRRALVEGRADRIRAAAAARDPSVLPRCAWFARGCEFQQAGICDCRGTEPPDPLELLDGLPPAAPRPEVEETWTRLASRIPPPVPSAIDGYADLVFPRRTLMDRADPGRVGAPGGEAPARDPTMKERLWAALDGEPFGALAAAPPRSDWAPGPVDTWDGIPYLLRVRQTYRAPTPESLARDTPHTTWELGVRCAAVGAREALLVLGRTRTTDPAEAARVYRYRFPDLGPVMRRWRAIVAALSRPGGPADPRSMPACPAWMARSCPHQPDCGCPSDPPVSR
ncbi:MAG: hypothetical protein QXG65_04085 [Thermoplasmata archaeon]